MTDNDIIVSFIDTNPVFKILTPTDKSRFISKLSVEKYSVDAVIHNNFDHSSSGFFVVNGSVNLKNTNFEKKVNAGHFFSCESVLGLQNHTAKAICIDECTIISLSDAALNTLINLNPDALAYFSANAFENLGTVEKQSAPATKLKTFSESSMFDFEGSIWSWLALLICTPALYAYMQTPAISSDARIFLTFLAVCIFMWVFRLVPYYIPALFTILGTLAVDIAPVKVVLSGFSSESFIMIMALSAVSLVVIKSGILYRALIKLLSVSKCSYNFYNFILFFIGSILTLFIPAIVTRCQIMAQLTNEARDLLNTKKTDSFSTSLAVTGFFGASLFSTIFFTGSLMNFLVQSILPTQEQTQFQSLGWIKASIMMGAFFLVGYLVAFFAVFFNKEKCELKKEILISKLNVIGKISIVEWCAISAVAFLSVGFFTYFQHHIHPAWVATITMLALVGVGAFSKKDFQTGIDWAFIIFIATCSGIGATLNYLGLNDTIAKNLVNLLGTNFKDPFYFISLIIISTLLIRMFLPITPSVLILCTIFIPISNFYNISPWLASIVILVTADMWFLPYQNFFYVMFEEFSNSNYNQKKFVLFNIIMNIVRVGAIYLSMPYWSKLGLM
jgi:DASS family divalent anion:Na+ symporter